MSRNGSGTYSLPAGNPVVTGTTISSTWANNTLSDIATALTQSIAYDGQTTPTANLPMGGFKHTGVAVGAALTDYARYDQLQNSSPQWLTGVAGTDTITASAPVTPAAYAAGQTFKFVAAGANTTTSVTLNVSSLGAKSVTKLGATALAVGDIPANSVVQVIYDGTQFQITGIANQATLKTYFDTLYLALVAPGASGNVLTSNGTAWTSSAPNQNGQAYLSLSAGNLKLSPRNGNKLIINGTSQSIPSSGVTLAATSLTPGTVYFIYAYMSGATMTLEASTTIHSTDTTTGVEIKNGDATRTLVGQAICAAGPAWVDSANQIGVVSWFNRTRKYASNVYTANRSTTSSAGWAEPSTEIRTSFIGWANDIAEIIATQIISNNTNSGVVYTAVAVDSSSFPSEGGEYSSQTNATDVTPATARTYSAITEGSGHYATILGLVSAGTTGTWAGGGSTGSRTSLTVSVMG